MGSDQSKTKGFILGPVHSWPDTLTLDTQQRVLAWNCADTTWTFLGTSSLSPLPVRKHKHITPVPLPLLAIQPVALRCLLQGQPPLE